MSSNYLIHYGIKDMHWGERRFQNPDGTLTEAGKKRYLNSDGSLNRRGQKAISKTYKKYTDLSRKNQDLDKIEEEAMNKTGQKIGRKIDEYDKAFSKKYGKNADFNSDEYINGIDKMFDDLYKKEYSKAVANSLNNDEYYKKAKAIREKYSNIQFDDLIKKGK